MSAEQHLPESFYARPLLELAADLLGRHLRADGLVLRITEVEAYAGPEDSASHGRFGATARNAAMWGGPGRLYVYLCYGIHRMLNVTAEGEGRCAAILLRSAELVAGEELARRRRGARSGTVDLAGPGKLGQVLALDGHENGTALFEAGGLELWSGRPAERIRRGPRVGIDFARPQDRRRAWRLADADSPALSRPEGLGRPRRRT
ncbi:MAG: DNA-3-methyladenine glycosylase [Planctomycetes bacterium]|nr:DNA-3-methyladenine glycosylase [Planctomycetota bacterium]